MKVQANKSVRGFGVLFALTILFGTFQGAATVSAQELVGAETCVGCHSEKGDAFKKTSHGIRLPVVKKVSFDKSCESCHGAGSQHVEAGGDRSNPGFATIGKVTAEKCLSCHKGGETMLWNVGAHAQADMDCTKCHSVHEAKYKMGLKLSSIETCLQCHKSERIGMNLPSHHPVKEGKMTCVSCHNPHGGEMGNLRAESAEELCFKCHAEKAGPFVHEHPPVAEDCGICHTPHGSQNERLLKERQPFLCMRCHPWPHNDRNAGTNAYKTAVKLPDRARCVECHNEIHGSDRKATFKQ